MPGERNARFSTNRIRGRKLGKMLQQIEDSTKKKKDSRDPKEEEASPKVLLGKRINMEGAEKTGWHTTSGSRDESNETG